MEKIKILYVLGSAPHYYVSVLNKLQKKYNVLVSSIVPYQKSMTVGAGVKEDRKGTEYKLIYDDEILSLVKKPFFKNFHKILKNEKPDIIVIGWPYIVGLLADIKSLYYIKKNKIGLVLKEIPFQVAPRNRFISYYKENPPYNENLENTAPKGIKFYFWAFGLMLLRSIYYKIIDITNIYTLQGIEIEKSYGISEDRIFFTGNSPDTDQIEQAREKLNKQGVSLTPRPYSLLHVGRLVKWKRVDLLLRAVALLKEEFPEIHLKVVGTGPELENLKQLSYELGLQKHVEFLGGVYGYENLGKIFYESAIYVLAGMGGLSINDAMAFGKPVICSVCDGTEKHLVFEGKNGLYFKEGNVQSLADKIRYLFQNPQLIEKFGKESLRIIREKENIHTVLERMYKSFLFLYNKKCNEKNN